MCQFFSFVGDGFGNYMYCDWEYRKSLHGEDCDSHTFILTEAKIPPKMQDRWSKYEYNPLTKEFTVDQEVGGHSHEDAEAWVSKLNFKTIVEPLIIKEIVDPFKLGKRKPTQEDIEDLEKWILVWNSVKGSMWDLVKNSVGNLAGYSIGSLVWYSVWGSLRGWAKDSVWSPLKGLVGGSVWDSIWSSVQDSIYAYFASFFDLDYGYDFSPFWRLWDRGLVPFYNGTTWGLYSGKEAEIVYEIAN